jgi:hypothetical protein
MASFLANLTKPSVTNAPPPPGEQWRNDIAVVAILIFALFLGYGIRNNALVASRDVALGEGLPTLKIPRNWTSGSSDDYVLEARDVRSASIFDPEVKVAVRPLRADETLGLVRTGLGMQRTQALLRYRELSAETVRVTGGRDGVLVTYAYVDDPSRAAGALSAPVVVLAQDLIFLVDDQAVIVTTAADAAGWSEDQFRVIYDSLRMNIQDVSMVPESPLGTPTPERASGFQEGTGTPAADDAATPADGATPSEEGDK